MSSQMRKSAYDDELFDSSTAWARKEQAINVKKSPKLPDTSQKDKTSQISTQPKAVREKVPHVQPDILTESLFAPETKPQAVAPPVQQPAPSIPATQLPAKTIPVSQRALAAARAPIDVGKAVLRYQPPERRLFAQLPSLSASEPRNEAARLQTGTRESVARTLAEYSDNPVMLNRFFRHGAVQWLQERGQLRGRWANTERGRGLAPRDKQAWRGLTAKNGRGGRFTWGHPQDDVEFVKKASQFRRYLQRVAEEQKWRRSHGLGGSVTEMSGNTVLSHHPNAPSGPGKTLPKRKAVTYPIARPRKAQKPRRPSLKKTLSTALPVPVAPQIPERYSEQIDSAMPPPLDIPDAVTDSHVNLATAKPMEMVASSLVDSPLSFTTSAPADAPLSSIPMPSRSKETLLTQIPAKRIPGVSAVARQMPVTRTQPRTHVHGVSVGAEQSQQVKQAPQHMPTPTMTSSTSSTSSSSSSVAAAPTVSPSSAPTVPVSTLHRDHHLSYFRAMKASRTAALRLGHAVQRLEDAVQHAKQQEAQDALVNIHLSPAVEFMRRKSAEMESQKKQTYIAPEQANIPRVVRADAASVWPGPCLDVGPDLKKMYRARDLAAAPVRDQSSQRAVSKTVIHVPGPGFIARVMDAHVEKPMSVRERSTETTTTSPPAAEIASVAHSSHFRAQAPPFYPHRGHVMQRLGPQQRDVYDKLTDYDQEDVPDFRELPTQPREPQRLPQPISSAEPSRPFTRSCGRSSAGRISLANKLALAHAIVILKENGLFPGLLNFANVFRTLKNPFSITSTSTDARVSGKSAVMPVNRRTASARTSARQASVSADCAAPVCDQGRNAATTLRDLETRPSVVVHAARKLARGQDKGQGETATASKSSAAAASWDLAPGWFHRGKGVAANIPVNTYITPRQFQKRHGISHYISRARVDKSKPHYFYKRFPARHSHRLDRHGVAWSMPSKRQWRWLTAAQPCQREQLRWILERRTNRDILLPEVLRRFPLCEPDRAAAMEEAARRREPAPVHVLHSEEDPVMAYSGAREEVRREKMMFGEERVEEGKVERKGERAGRNKAAEGAERVRKPVPHVEKEEKQELRSR